MRRSAILLLTAFIGSSCGDDRWPLGPSGSSSMGFFVTSTTSVTGNLGGLAGADATCQQLAASVGHGLRTWRAYLSVERDPANGCHRSRPTETLRRSR